METSILLYILVMLNNLVSATYTLFLSGGIKTKKKKKKQPNKQTNKQKTHKNTKQNKKQV